LSHRTQNFTAEAAAGAFLSARVPTVAALLLVLLLGARSPG
jgi:hypothetical protein